MRHRVVAEISLGVGSFLMAKGELALLQKYFPSLKDHKKQFAFMLLLMHHNGVLLSNLGWTRIVEAKDALKILFKDGGKEFAKIVGKKTLFGATRKLAKRAALSFYGRKALTQGAKGLFGTSMGGFYLIQRGWGLLGIEPTGKDKGKNYLWGGDKDFWLETTNMSLTATTVAVGKHYLEKWYKKELARAITEKAKKKSVETLGKKALKGVVKQVAMRSLLKKLIPFGAAGTVLFIMELFEMFRVSLMNQYELWYESEYKALEKKSPRVQDNPASGHTRVSFTGANKATIGWLQTVRILRGQLFLHLLKNQKFKKPGATLSYEDLKGFEFDLEFYVEDEHGNRRWLDLRDNIAFAYNADPLDFEGSEIAQAHEDVRSLFSVKKVKRCKIDHNVQNTEVVKQANSYRRSRGGSQVTFKKCEYEYEPLIKNQDMLLRYVLGFKEGPNGPERTVKDLVSDLTIVESSCNGPIGKGNGTQCLPHMYRTKSLAGALAPQENTFLENRKKLWEYKSMAHMVMILTKGKKYKPTAEDIQYGFFTEDGEINTRNPFFVKAARLTYKTAENEKISFIQEAIRSGATGKKWNTARVELFELAKKEVDTLRLKLQYLSGADKAGAEAALKIRGVEIEPKKWDKAKILATIFAFDAMAHSAELDEAVKIIGNGGTLKGLADLYEHLKPHLSEEKATLFQQIELYQRVEIDMSGTYLDKIDHLGELKALGLDLTYPRFNDMFTSLVSQWHTDAGERLDLAIELTQKLDLNPDDVVDALNLAEAQEKSPLIKQKILAILSGKESVEKRRTAAQLMFSLKLESDPDLAFHLIDIWGTADGKYNAQIEWALIHSIKSDLENKGYSNIYKKMVDFYVDYVTYDVKNEKPRSAEEMISGKGTRKVSKRNKAKSIEDILTTILDEIEHGNLLCYKDMVNKLWPIAKRFRNARKAYFQMRKQATVSAR
jgi:hypothetical protein